MPEIDRPFQYETNVRSFGGNCLIPTCPLRAVSLYLQSLNLQEPKPTLAQVKAMLENAKLLIQNEQPQPPSLRAICNLRANPTECASLAIVQKELPYNSFPWRGG